MSRIRQSSDARRGTCGRVPKQKGGVVVGEAMKVECRDIVYVDSLNRYQHDRSSKMGVHSGHGLHQRKVSLGGLHSALTTFT